MPKDKLIRIYMLLHLVVFTSAKCTVAEGLNSAESTVPQDDVICLFNGKNFDGLYTFLEDTRYEDPRQVFTVRDEILVVSGDGYGGITTKRAHRNYRLVCEFKWGERVWGERKRRVRDSGILIHGNGVDGAFLGRWMTSIEAQIIEGGMGDILVVNQNDSEAPCRVSVTAEIQADRDGEFVWTTGGKKKIFCEGRVNWCNRDPNWEDTLGFRGRDDLDESSDGWTKMELICKGDKIQVFTNGILVNEVFDVVPNSGQITLQAEAAEIFVRRWELWPLEEQN